MRRSLAAIAAACLLALAGCGGATHHAVTQKVAPGPSTHPCSANDAVMQCVLPAPPASLAPTTTPAIPGADYGWGTVTPAIARAHGWRFVASYLSSDKSKNFTASAVRAFHSSRVATVVVWETSATRALGGYAAGHADALAAGDLAVYLGEPHAPLYFAIDFDESAAQAGAVAAYFRGVDAELGVRRAGAYGSYWAVKRLFDAHLITYGWQTYAWSGGLWDRRAQLQQYLNGSSFDLDRAVTRDYGQAPPPAVPAVLPVCLTHRMSRSACAAVKKQIASDRRAAASSGRAYTARGCDVLGQRVSWYSTQLKHHPKVKAASRRRALALSRAAYRQRSCAGFRSRVVFFDAAAATLTAAS